jgi:ankyrin repeat protein
VGQRPYDTAIERDNKPAADLLAAAEDEVHIAPENALLQLQQEQYTLNRSVSDPRHQQEPSPVGPTRSSNRLTSLTPGTPSSSRLGALGDGGGAVKGFSSSVSLHSAAVMPDIAVLRRAIAGPPEPNLNAKDLEGKTPLHAAVEAGCAANAVELIKAGADPNAKDKLGHTPLRAACARGNAGLARELVALGANPAAQDNSGDTPVHAAAGNGDPATVLAVIDDPSVKQIKNKDGQLPFDVAAAKGPSHAEAAELLREAVKASAVHTLFDGPESEAVYVKDAEVAGTNEASSWYVHKSGQRPGHEFPNASAGDDPDARRRPVSPGLFRYKMVDSNSEMQHQRHRRNSGGNSGNASAPNASAPEAAPMSKWSPATLLHNQTESSHKQPVSPVALSPGSGASPRKHPKVPTLPLSSRGSASGDSTPGQDDEVLDYDAYWVSIKTSPRKRVFVDETPDHGTYGGSFKTSPRKIESDEPGSSSSPGRPAPGRLRGIIQSARDFTTSVSYLGPNGVQPTVRAPKWVPAANYQAPLRDSYHQHSTKLTPIFKAQAS